jgi:hypothetical protein
MTVRGRTATVAVGMLALAVLGLAVFVLPFAYTTPPPIVTRFTATSLFSPNGDGRRDVARVSIRVRTPSHVALDVRDSGGRSVRLLLDEERGPGWSRLSWGGRDEAGRTLPDGQYVLALRARSGRKRFNISRRIVLDTTAPRIERMDVASAALAGGPGECRTSLVAADDARARVEVARATGGPPVLALGFRPIAGGGELRWTWDGRGRGGRPVRPGLYVVRGVLRDAPGNETARIRSCWVGHIVGRAVPPRPQPGERVGVALTDSTGRPLPGATPTQLALYRRAATPGRHLTGPLGPRVGGRARGRADRVSVRLPRRLRPDALWLVATTPRGRALVPLGAGG